MHMFWEISKDFKVLIQELGGGGGVGNSVVAFDCLSFHSALPADSPMCLFCTSFAAHINEILGYVLMYQITSSFAV